MLQNGHESFIGKTITHADLFPPPESVLEYLRNSRGVNPFITDLMVWWNKGPILEKEALSLQNELRSTLPKGHFEVHNFDDGNMILIVSNEDAQNERRSRDDIVRMFNRLDIIYQD